MKKIFITMIIVFCCYVVSTAKQMTCLGIEMNNNFVDNLIEKYENCGLEAVGRNLAKFLTGTNVFVFLTNDIGSDIFYKSAPFSREGGLRKMFLCGFDIAEIRVYLKYNFTNNVSIKIGNQTEEEVRQNFNLYNYYISKYDSSIADSIFFSEVDFYKERWSDIEFKKSQYELVKSYMDLKYGTGEKINKYSYEYSVFDGYELIGLITLNLEEDFNENNKKYYYIALYYYQVNEQEIQKYLNEL